MQRAIMEVRWLVEDYKFHALARYGRAWVAYEVIAALGV
jgi:hypothetical protein